jgi:hypothetical protein
MSFRSSAVAVLAAVLCPACTSTPKAPCADTQRAVESVAVLYPDCVRLTVHSIPPGGGQQVIVASTLPEKLGLASGPEDLEAMRSGKTIVLDEPGALDVTVPIGQKDGAWTAACGVTMRGNHASQFDRDMLRARARQIAKAVEAAMASNTTSR